MESHSSIEGIQSFVRNQACVRVRGGGSKPALSAEANLSLSGLSGVLEYEPSEYTFTALAGTPVAEIERLLAQHGQYLALDPPLARSGATLGGTVAAGLSGPGRFRYGGVRDFILGVRLVDGQGQLVRGGGKVVKNAAGFEFAKLMVGSLGRFGVLVELSLKVFPAPERTATLAVDLADVQAAVAAMSGLAASSLDLACLDLEPPGRLWLRIGGRAESLPTRLERLRKTLQSDARQIDIFDHEDAGLWDDARQFAWVPEGHGLVKIPLLPAQIIQMEPLLASLECPVPRRYSVGGNVAWVAWPETVPPAGLDDILATIGRPAVALTGRWPRALFGAESGREFADRLVRVFDPDGRFQDQQQSVAT